MKILLLEDNEAITKALIYLLEQNGFAVTTCSTISSIEKINISDYQLILLDIALPDGDGITFYKNLSNKNIPVIFLTAKEEEEDITECFNLGCADYITKPFKTGELLARIKRIMSKKNNEIILKDIRVDIDKMLVYRNGVEVSLSSLEYKILLLLLNNMNKIITREFILNQIWDTSLNFVEDNTLTVYIKRIRSKIGEDKIKTIKGIGYRVDSI